MNNYLIIGGSSGIGKALVDDLIFDGYNVFATYNQTNPDNVNTNVKFQQIDTTTEFTLTDLPEVLDGIVYCPGSINLKPFPRIKGEDFLSDYNLQVVGAVKVIQQVLPLLKKSDLGSIVLFSTVAVQNGFPFHSLISSSKGAIEGLTKALSAEFAPNIRVNCIAPSITDTPLASKLLSTEEKKDANAKRHPLQKIGSAEDIAQTAKFLLSNQSKWITGQILHVDGGISSIKN